MDTPTQKIQTEPAAPALRQLRLPEGTTLYVGGGIPQVFRRVITDRETETGEWLYLPDALLTQIAEEYAGGVGENAAVPEPVCVEEGGRFYPVIAGGAIRGLVSDTNSGNTSDLQPVFSWMAEEELQAQARRLPIQAELTAALVATDTTPERLVRSALNLMVEQVPSGLAALYGESEGIYRMRTAVGDITMWDMLEGAVPHSTLIEWREAIAQGRHFLPVGFLPERPMLLDGPPNFLFVHHGLQSDRSRAFVLMPVPGDIPREAGERLLMIARFVAALDEYQLSFAEDLLGICSLFRSACERGMSFEDLLERAFDVLASRLGLSRLVYIDDAGRADAVIGRHDGPPSVRKETPPSVATGVRAAASAGRFFTPDVSAGELLRADEAKRYYLDNVRSEYCLRPLDAGGAESCVAYGHPEIGPRLKQFEKLLETTTMFLHLHRRLDRVLTHCEGDCAFGKTSGKGMERRFATASTMAEGHFHSVFDTLSWLLGRTEMQAEASESGSESAEQNPITSITEQALERVVRHLDQLRGILREAASLTDDPVPIERILAELPAMLQGRSHHLQDLKNVAVSIVIGQASGKSFSMVMRDVYEYVYPVLLAVMDGAVMAGEVRVRSGTHRGADAVEITLPKKLIGRHSLAQIIEQSSGEAGAQESGGRLLFSCGRYVWVCDTPSRDPQRAWLVARNDVHVSSANRPSARRDWEAR